MENIRKSTATAIAGVGALVLLATPSFAASDHGATKLAAPVRTAHMGQGQGGQWAGQPCPMGMMSQGKMGSGMGSQGMMGRGMMSQDQGMMGRGMMGQSKGGQGMMGLGLGKGPGLDNRVVASKDLTADDVRHFLEHRLKMHGNKRLKLGEIKEADDDKIVADITTMDGSLVQRFEVDQHTGQMRGIE